MTEIIPLVWVGRKLGWMPDGSQIWWTYFDWHLDRWINICHEDPRPYLRERFGVALVQVSDIYDTLKGTWHLL